MVDAIRPGGWLCLEETDWLTSGLSEPRTPALERFWAAVGELMTSTGGDPNLGRKLGTAVQTAGLANVGGEAWVRVRRDGLGTQLDLLGPVLTSAKLITEDEVDLSARRGRCSGPDLQPHIRRGMGSATTLTADGSSGALPAGQPDRT